MRRRLTFVAMRHGKRETTRLFTMSRHQADLFHSLTESVANGSGMAKNCAASLVEETVCNMLNGKEPPEEAKPIFHQIRTAFPVLRRRDIQRLPRSGCPDWPVKGVVIALPSSREPSGMFVFTYRFDEDQQNFFRNLVEAIVDAGCCLDRAWLVGTSMVGRLIEGADCSTFPLQFMVLRGVGLFSAIPHDKLLERTPTTEDDLAELTFTNRPIE